VICVTLMFTLNHALIRCLSSSLIFFLLVNSTISILGKEAD